MWSKKRSYDFTPRTEPMKHQIEAIDYLRIHEAVPLFDEQGLGKSKTVIDALLSNLADGSIDAVLIIAKKSLMYMWRDEIRRHSHLFPIIIEGNKTKRGRKLLSRALFYIIGYETLIQELNVVYHLLKQRRFAIVLDESQRIKNPESKTTNAVFSLRPLSVKRVILTGTPIANRPVDLWSQFFFLDGGELLGYDFLSFKKQYTLDLHEKIDFETEHHLAELRQKVNSVSIRRTKNVLDLPEKRYQNVMVKLAERQQEIYDVAREELYYEISNTDGELITDEIENYLVKLLRLTQIASNPGLIVEDYDEIPSKFKKLDQVLRKVIQHNEKAIVWTSFVDNILTLKLRYKNYGSLLLFGDISIEERHRTVTIFNNNPEKKVLIANPAAAKEGLTLTSANNAIYLDRTFKMDDYLQSQDRIHRISQTKKCRIIKLLAVSTVDEYTDEILEKKESIAKYTLGDRESINMGGQYLTKEDLLRILG